MYEVGWRGDPYLQARRRNDLETSRGAVIRRHDSAHLILLPGDVIAVLFDENDVGRDDRRNKVRLAGSRIVDSSRPTLHPIALVRRPGCGRTTFALAHARDGSGCIDIPTGLQRTGDIVPTGRVTCLRLEPWR